MNEPMDLNDALRDPAAFVAGMEEAEFTTTAHERPLDQCWFLRQESGGRERVSTTVWPSKRAAVDAYIGGDVKWEPWA